MKQGILGASIVIALLLAACGGSGSSSGGHPETEQGLEDAAREAFRLTLEDEPREAYEYLSEECRETLSYSDFAGQILLGKAFFEAFFEVDFADLRVKEARARDVADGRGEVLLVLEVDGDEDVDLGGDDEYAEYVYEEGDWRSTDCENLESGDGGPTPTTIPADTPGASRDNPAPVGSALEIAGWSIVVTDVIPDATDFVLSGSDFAEPPEPGRQFFLISLRATYDGDDEASSLAGAVTFGAVGPSNLAYEEFEDTCGFDVPDEIDSFRDVFQGGTLEGNICWSVQSTDAPGLVLFAQESFSFDDIRLWWSLAP